MQSPLRITFRHMDSAPALEAHIREHLERLEALCDSIVSCNVLVDATRRHGKIMADGFNVKIDLTMPGHHVVVHGGHGDALPQPDAHAAVRAAFDTLRRLVQEHLASQRAGRKSSDRSTVRA